MIIPETKNKNQLFKFQAYLPAIYFTIHELFNSYRLSEISLTTLAINFAGASLFIFFSAAFFSRFVTSPVKASLLTFALFVIVFFFPTWVDIILDVSEFNKMIIYIDFHKKAVIFCFLMLVYCILGWIIWKSKTNFRPFAGYLTLLILCLIIFELVNAFNYKPNNLVLNDKFQPQITNPKTRPDIYYIILDHYSGNSALKKYDYNNTYFTEFLEKKGFYVSYNSKSNYNYTSSSLSSSLNSSYLNITNKGRYSESDVAKLTRFISENKVLENLNKYGYKENIYTIYPVKDTPASLMERPRDKAGKSKSFLATLTRALYQKFDIGGQQDLHKIFYSYNIGSFRFLDSLVNSQTDPKNPAFNFVHTLTAHTPFVIDSAGEFQKNVSLTHDRKSYIREIRYVNKRLMSFINHLLSKPGEKPVIIIQSDHGSHLNDLKETSSILNAYYFPDKNYSDLYQTITPVNSFRIVFNKYFNADLPLLPDRNFYVFYP